MHFIRNSFIKNRDVVINHILLRYTLMLILLVCPMAHGVEVVSHSSVDVEALSIAQLRRIYSMRQQRWPNNTSIIVFTLPSDSPLHKKFSNQKLRLFPYQLDRIWNKLTFSGLGLSPTVLKNQEELIQAVKNTPGSIGYVNSLNGEEHVNVIKVGE